MAILPVLTDPNPILHQKASPVARFDETFWSFLDDLQDTLLSDETAVGLAAPQVGVLERVFLYVARNQVKVLVNPEIVEAAGNEVGEEGCLSLPGCRIPVRRYQRIVVSAQNEQGHPVLVREKGFPARIIQHELDHLDGILITDRFSELQKEPQL